MIRQNEERRPTSRRVRASRSLASLLLLSAASMILGAPAARADHGGDIGDQLAAPAIVHVNLTQNYVITFHDMHHGGGKTFEENVPRPSGLGVIVNPAGLVITTPAIAYPVNVPIEAINRAFSRFHPTRWTAGQLSRRNAVPDPEMNEVLQDCYRGGPLCTVVDRGRQRWITLDTAPTAKVIKVTGRSQPDSALIRMETVENDKSWSRSTIPTVGVATEVAPDAEFTALGYNSSGALVRMSGTLDGGHLATADITKMAAQLVNGGDGTVLVDPHSKGTVIGMVVHTAGHDPVVLPMGDFLADAGLRVERGTLDATIDEALGYFSTEHYGHAAVLLQKITQVYPHRELVADLATANRLKGGSQDKSLSEMDHMDDGHGHEAMSIPWVWIIAGVAAALAVAAVVILLLRRRRRAGGAVSDANASGVDEDEDDLAFEDEGLDPDHAAPADVDATAGHHGDHTNSDHAQGDRAQGDRAQGDHPGDSDVLTANPVAAGIGTGAQSLPGRPIGRPGASFTTLIPTDQIHDPRSLADHYCPQCGAGLLAGDRFCYQCGSPAR